MHTKSKTLSIFALSPSFSGASGACCTENFFLIKCLGLAKLTFLHEKRNKCHEFYQTFKLGKIKIFIWKGIEIEYSSQKGHFLPKRQGFGLPDPSIVVRMRFAIEYVVF